MFIEKIIFKGGTNYISSGHQVSNFQSFSRGEVPSLLLIEGGHINTSGHENAAREMSNSLEGSLDTIENVLKNTYILINSLIVAEMAFVNYYLVPIQLRAGCHF